MLEWAHQGVNISVPRNGGVECAEFLTMKVRTLETIVVMMIFGPLFLWAIKRLSPVPTEWKEDRPEPTLKRVLLVAMCLIWGIEIGFKFSSRTVIFLLNPCHITTAMQIYLLAARPSKRVGALFRFQMNCMNGAVLALAFPELDALNLPFETWLYWIQHTMMMIIPLYLITLGGVYAVEAIEDFSWSIMSYCVIIFYHFIILQGIGLPAKVNLNHMLCPAVRDPFDGRWYRVFAVVHQALLCPSLAKLFAFIGNVYSLIHNSLSFKIHAHRTAGTSQSADRSHCRNTGMPDGCEPCLTYTNERWKAHLGFLMTGYVPMIVEHLLPFLISLDVCSVVFKIVSQSQFKLVQSGDTSQPSYFINLF